MGREPVPKPARLAEKLLRVRTLLELSQNGMLRRMGLAEVMRREEISDFERGRRVPPLPVLLAYARAAGFPVEVLIDDKLKVPARLPTGLDPNWVKKWADLLLPPKV